MIIIKSLISLLLILCIPVLSIAQLNGIVDLKFHGLKGKVKNYQLTYYNYLQNLKEGQWIYDEEDYNYIRKCKFNQDGKLLERANYFKGNSKPGFRVTYTYGSDGKVEYFTTYYNEEERCKYVYVYDDEGKWQKIKPDNLNLKSWYDISFEYQNSELTIESFNKIKKNGVVDDITYNKEVYHIERGVLLRFESILYRHYHSNKHMNSFKDGEMYPYQSTVKDLIGNFENKIIYQYEFDDQGNWIKRYGYSEDKKYNEVSVRKIEYFK